MATTYMLLTLPTPTVTNGPQWATDVNTAITTIDSHDHTSGKGNRIPTQGLNINEDLDFNANHINEAASVRLINQSSALNGSDDVDSIYSVNGELYYNNSAGTPIAMTSNGSIATPSSTNTPPGIVLPYAGVSAPTGYLLCTGAAVSRTTYSALFAIIGTTYGSGNGTTTFNLPNMNGRVPMGIGSYTDTVSGVLTRTLAQTLGAAAHVLTTNELAAHGHPLTVSTSYRPEDFGTASATLVSSGSPDSVVNLTSPNVTAASVGGSVAHNNMQPSLGLNFIIKT